MKRALTLLALLCLPLLCLAAEPPAKSAPKQYSLGEFDYDWYGSVSRDGRWLAFIDWDTGDLAVRELATGKNRRLTNKGSWAESSEYALFPTISPASEGVAYTWFDERGPSLRLIRLDGTGRRILHRDEGIDSYEPQDWSPDGQLLLVTFVRTEGANQMALLNVSDGSVRVLQNLSGARTPLRAKFSPDGRSIAYDFPATPRSTNWDLFLLRADGQSQTPLVEHPRDDLLIDWTSDGLWLVFASRRTGAWGIWALPMREGRAAGRPRLLKDNVASLFFPVGLTSKGALYYGVMSETADLYVAALDNATGKLRPAEKLASDVGGMSSTDWSPDGRELAYVVRRGPLGTGYVAYSWALVIRSLRTGQQREVPLALSRMKWFQPRWSPDGRWLLASGWDPKGRFGVYLIDVGSGEVKPIARQRHRGDPQYFGWEGAVWSPDGKAIFFRRRDGKQSILTRTLSTGEEKELYATVLPSFVGNVAVSADGRWLAFLSGTESRGEAASMALNLMPAAGGEPRELLSVQAPESLRQLAWTPDGRHLIFGRSRPLRPDTQEQRFELWRIAAEGGEPENLGLAMKSRTLFGLSIHPNGRRIAFTAERPFRSELYVFENFLPASQAAGGADGAPRIQYLPVTITRWPPGQRVYGK